MLVRVIGHLTLICTIIDRRIGIHRRRARRIAHLESILHQGNTQTRARAVFGGVRGVQQVGEQEADELEGHGNERVPDEGEEGADEEAVDEDVIRVAGAGVGGEDCGLPVGRCGVRGGLLVGGWFLVCVVAGAGLGGYVCEDAVVGAG